MGKMRRIRPPVCPLSRVHSLTPSRANRAITCAHPQPQIRSIKPPSYPRSWRGRQSSQTSRSARQPISQRTRWAGSKGFTLAMYACVGGINPSATIFYGRVCGWALGVDKWKRWSRDGWLSEYLPGINETRDRYMSVGGGGSGDEEHHGEVEMGSGGAGW
ncbi:hypothetical protein BU16DRAFT_1901 [Lophium mytilinum]|uniref:Uncharacterized protein n=1 Tax=Lophium mytilinum TaxID=390894 RepID=A0A6A6REP4_9PEZI|nr:hypothetical protein BU16DRAFT_1901 [Lophium mytilinum]